MAAVLATAITWFFYRRIVHASGPSKTVAVVASATNLPVGVTLSTKDVTLMDWPSDVTLAGSFSKPEDVIGRPLLYPVGPKEPILARDLGVQGSGIGLAGKIPEGMRATAVRSNEIVGVAGFLYPGSHVDILSTYNASNGQAPLTETVLQNVEVLTAGQTIEPDPQGKPQQVNVVTLLLSPEDSQKAMLASQQGNIQFVLRSGVDQKKVDLKATSFDDVVGGIRKPQEPVKRMSGGVKRAAAPLTNPRHALEIIQGTQKTVQTF